MLNRTWVVPFYSVVLLGCLGACTTVSQEQRPLSTRGPAGPAALRNPGAVEVYTFRVATHGAEGLVVPFDEEAGEAADGGDGGAQGHSLAEQSQNPVADLISLPFEWNIQANQGPQKETGHVLNIKPVIPYHINDDWNLINRAIIPLVSQPRLGRGEGRRNGLGDTNLQFFFSPSDSDPIWGVGPAFIVPSATNTRLGSSKWAVGPTAVVLKIDKPWVYGSLAQHVWSVGGSDASHAENINQTLLQPFVNYNMEGGWYWSSNPVITADWKADKGGDIWTVPVGGGLGRVTKFGNQPVNIAFRGFYNVVRPRDTSNFTAQLSFTFLYPQKKPQASVN